MASKHRGGSQKNEKWRVCVDYKDLNKSYLEDCFSMPNIDQLIEFIDGHEHLSFLDAYFGYNQIKWTQKIKLSIGGLTCDDPIGHFRF